MTTIKIGTSSNKQELWKAEYTHAEFARFGQASEIVQIKTANRSYDALAEALLRGEIDVAVYSLDKAPVAQPEGLVITALSKREAPEDWLVFRKEAYVPTEIFKAKKDAVLGAASLSQKVQMLDYRPDVEVADIVEDAFLRLEKLQGEDYDAIFMAAADVKRLDLELSSFEIVVLNPREFVPAIGQGVLAWLCNRDDVTTRRILKQMHHSEVSACTNIERKVQQLMEGQEALAVYCERDAAGNYHVSAACQLDGSLRRKQVSSSTSVGAAEKVVAGLKN